MKKILTLGLVVFVFGLASVASAHVVVTPSTIGIASRTEFDVSVPVEENIPTIGLRLLIPSGVTDVQPNVKPGWSISVKKDGTGDGANVTEIDWTGGTIPVGEHDDFIFKAQVPSSPVALDWKAYQTYSDGSIVPWDQDPSTIAAGEEGNPYSITSVIDDLSATSSSATNASTCSALGLSIVAIFLSLVAIVISVKRTEKNK